MLDPPAVGNGDQAATMVAAEPGNAAWSPTRQMNGTNFAFQMDISGRGAPGRLHKMDNSGGRNVQLEIVGFFRRDEPSNASVTS
jgi:hypothetical protein